MDRESHKKIVDHIKGQLKYHVDQKVALTRCRSTYRVSSRETVPEYKRQMEFHRIDAQRRELKNDIRHLHLTYGYIRGQALIKMERKSKKPIGISEITSWLKTTIIDILKIELEIDDHAVENWIYGGPSQFARPKQTKTTEVAA